MESILSVGTSSSSIGRFVGKVGSCTRRLNQIAAKELKSRYQEPIFPKASAEDLKRLTSKDIKDTYKRVAWTNPKDGKLYHLLEESRDKKGVNIRILSSEGEFIKNATLQPKNIVIFDQFKTLSGIRNLLKFKFTKTPSHGEIVETYLKRANPFANVEHLEHKKNIFELLKYRGKLPLDLATKRFNELDSQIKSGKKIDYISLSETNMGDIGKYSKASGKYQNYIMQEYGLVEELNSLINAFKSILKKGTRIFISSGNEGETAVNKFLAVEGVEGVGAYNRLGRVAKSSSSRNSIFTQHYECGKFAGKVVEENGKKIGINITGLPGTDLPYNKKNKHLLRFIQGTSYSTPIRVGKIALNDMMEGII